MKTNWIEYGNDWRQFRSEGLSNSGTQVELRQPDGTTSLMLIGDLNEEGGLCDCCSCGGTVTRYRVLLTMDQGSFSGIGCGENLTADLAMLVRRLCRACPESTLKEQSLEFLH